MRPKLILSLLLIIHIACNSREKFKMQLGSSTLYYSGSVTEDQAKAALRIISEMELFPPSETLYRLDHGQEGFNLWIAPSGSEKGSGTSLRAFAELLSLKAFGNAPVELILCDENFNEEQRISYRGVSKEKNHLNFTRETDKRWAI